ncbi:MAG: NAD(P)-dependent glycerol-3-phosphate dehydrogenase [Planctomycetes bacterium]|nr:NAD(P)-dependent glycerol-3-phosphate dehydrogenase [Planctomycetota bacterium]
MNIQILGAGGWGTALAVVLARQGVPVRLWARSPERIEELRGARENRRYLPGVSIPEAVGFGLAPAADLAVVAVPTQHIRAALGGLGLPRVPVVSAAKGLEMSTHLRPTEILGRLFGTPTAALSGPSHAEEVARGLPATLVAASADEALAKTVQKLFMGETLRIYTSTDVIGVETAGALKNIIAIAAGICDSLGLGDNAKAALLTRGIVEIARLGAKMGAQRPTFFGVSGIGDLITTCYSLHGRNLRVGREVGKGRALSEVLAEMSMVAEGVWTSKAALELAREKGVEMPITEAVVRILHQGKAPREAVRELMGRLPKSETEDWA